MRILVCLVLMTLILNTAVNATPLAADGELNLSEHPLEETGPVDLKGKWHFYWGAFHKPDGLEDYNPLQIETPAPWGSQSQDIDNHGYGTYHLRIFLSDRDGGRALGLFIPSIASAFDLYINGEKLASGGKAGTSRDDMTAAALPQPLYFTPEERVLDLVVHVSNFTQRKGGMWNEIRLGTADQITKERDHRLLFQAFIATGLLIMGIYHVGLYFFRSAKSTLFFGLASLALCLRMVFVGDIIAVHLFPAIPWELLVKIEYLSVFYGISFLVLYFYHLYENNLHRITSYAFALVMIVLTTPIFVLPAVIYTEWMLFYQLILLVLVLYILYGLVRAAIHKLTGARMNLAVGLIFLATVLNDILYYNFLLDSIDLVTLGLFLFIFTQMFMLANKFASAYREVEVLKDALVETNQNLEAIVRERTEALLQSNERLIKAEKSRRDLLSNITHELGNPLTAIIGYLKAIKDGVSRDSQERHIQIAYQKALKLERMTDDLRNLVKLEQGQVTLELQSVYLRTLYHKLEHAYDWDMLDRRMMLNFDLPQQSKYVVWVDMDRIEQVFANIVNNALAHTKKNDHIEITGRFFSFAKACAISIRDTGIGITKEDQKQLFDRYYRVQNIHSKRTDGTGLGLTISKSIIERHNGKIGVRSKYRQGSTFYFILRVGEEKQP